MLIFLAVWGRVPAGVRVGPKIVAIIPPLRGMPRFFFADGREARTQFASSLSSRHIIDSALRVE
jgi:hypothetical protein